MFQKKHLDKETLIVFARQLSLIMDSDVTLHDGLSMVFDKSENKTLGNIIETILKDLEEGAQLHEALRKHEGELTPFFVSMVEVGEKSGNLVEVLEQIAHTYEMELETSEKVKGAISYPIILSVLMLGVVVLLVVQILPMFREVLDSLGGSMPALTVGMLNISTWITKHVLQIFLLVLIVIVSVYSYKKTESGRFLLDRFKFYIPIHGSIYRAVIGMNFSRNLGLLVRSGISITEGLEMLIPVFKNVYFKKKIQDAKDGIEASQALDSAMEGLKIYPWVIMKLFIVAGKTGHLDEVFLKSAQVMEQETDRLLKRLTSVLEPILILILSIIVGVILLSVVLPVVRIMNAIG